MTGLFAVILVVLHLSLEMVVPALRDFDHFPLKLIAVYLIYSLSPFLSSRLGAERHRAQGRPRSKGGQYQSAGAGAAVLLPLLFPDPFLYQRHAGFMAIHASDTPSPQTPEPPRRKKGAPRPRNDRGRSAPLDLALSNCAQGKRTDLCCLSVCREYIAEKHYLSSPLFLNITKRRELSLRPQLDIKIHFNFTGKGRKNQPLTASKIKKCNPRVIPP